MHEALTYQTIKKNTQNSAQGTNVRNSQQNSARDTNVRNQQKTHTKQCARHYRDKQSTEYK